MSYATVQQVRDVLARDLTHPAATAASLPDAQIQEHLDDASNQVDSALGFTFPTPFGQPFPPQVVTICRDIAAYLADLTFRGTKDYATTNNPVMLRNARALAMIKDLQNGAAKLLGWPPPGDSIDQPSTEGGSVLAPVTPTANDLTSGLNMTGPDELGWNPAFPNPAAAPVFFIGPGW